jgi:hypothetical protein
MLAVAAKRSEGHPNATFRQADAEIPAEDGAFDAVLCPTNDRVVL